MPFLRGQLYTMGSAFIGDLRTSSFLFLSEELLSELDGDCAAEVEADDPDDVLLLSADGPEPEPVEVPAPSPVPDVAPAPDVEEDEAGIVVSVEPDALCLRAGSLSPRGSVPSSSAARHVRPHG